MRATGRALLLLAAGLASTAALAQFSTEPRNAAPGEVDPVDAILARRLAMTTLGRQNDQVHDILDRGPSEDLARVRSNLDTISVFLLTFPQMFPQGSLIHSEALEAEEPGKVSLALPTVWENWNDFYTRSLVASDTAYRAGRAPSYEEVLRLTEELEQQCEACHALYRTDQPPIVPPMLQAPAATEPAPPTEQ